MVWLFGGLVVWWFGGLVVWWFITVPEYSPLKGGELKGGFRYDIHT